MFQVVGNFIWQVILYLNKGVVGCVHLFLIFPNLSVSTIIVSICHINTQNIVLLRTCSIYVFLSSKSIHTNNPASSLPIIIVLIILLWILLCVAAAAVAACLIRKRRRKTKTKIIDAKGNVYAIVIVISQFIIFPADSNTHVQEHKSSFYEADSLWY